MKDELSGAQYNMRIRQFSMTERRESFKTAVFVFNRLMHS